MKINCLIIEDEIPNANRIQKLLGQTEFEISILAVLPTIKDTIYWLNNNQHPDLLLLDIRLADGISFEIFNKVNIEVPIIFTTAYDDYALDAFKVNSIDYLLKPIKLFELNAALLKFSKQQILKPEKHLLNLLNSLNKNQVSYRNRLLVSFRDQYISLTIDQIAYFYSQNKVTYLTTHKGEKYITDFTLERLEEELNPNIFFRASRQLIISEKCINKILNHFSGKIKLELTPKLDEISKLMNEL